MRTPSPIFSTYDCNQENGHVLSSNRVLRVIEKAAILIETPNSDAAKINL